MNDKPNQKPDVDPPPRNDVTIIVNGRRKVVKKGQLSFEEVLQLGLGDVPTGENWVFTVTYTKGPKQNPKGTLTAGQKVKVDDGMIFNVTATDKS
jgi:hypothetical protein